MAHEGPDPVAHWSFNSRTVEGSRCEARLGPALQLEGECKVSSDRLGEALDLTGWNNLRVPASDFVAGIEAIPTEALTISVWVAIDEAEAFGSLVGHAGTQGDQQTGWQLGYNGNVFTFALAGTETSHAKRTVLQGKTSYEKGRWYHVTGVYDGERMELYVNGKLEASTDAEQGSIRLATDAPFRIGTHAGAEESYPLRGRLREVSLYDLAARETWVAHAFEHNQRLVALPADARADRLAFVVKPYLQFGTKTTMTVMWQTSEPATSVLHYGIDERCDKSVKVEGNATIHEVTIEGLEAESQYFYRIESVNKAGESLTSRPSTFMTAVNENTPFAFAVISDTQNNPVVAGQVSHHAWSHRPSFLLHAGDLVDTGTIDLHWTQHFFPGMNELISRVPFYPVLGNHEQNARNYFEYMSLPAPEYYYTFRYGNAQFFMIDTNRNVNPGSEQYEWLEKGLAASDAAWKFVCHHHPPYSSDENDYGDLWKTSKSTRGDLRARQLSPLYEKYGVDIVWNGHIHSYERTWPVKEGKAVDSDAPFYMITGGGGGGLETPGPTRPFFQNHVRRGHHFVMVHINGSLLELRSFDIDGKLFDTVALRKEG